MNQSIDQDIQLAKDQHLYYSNKIKSLLEQLENPELTEAEKKEKSLAAYERSRDDWSKRLSELNQLKLQGR
jgi:Txe/YoeB family toxin of Txe-Axe toxin-antitoxin module